MPESIWTTEWSEGDLTTLPQHHLDLYPPKARAFLASNGFPRRIDVDASTKFTFEPMLNAPEPYVAEDGEDFGGQLVIGEVDFDGGASLVCVLDAEDETVSLLDPDDEELPVFVNSDLALFAASLLQAALVLNRSEVAEFPIPPIPTSDIESLADVLRAIDPDVFTDEGCFWVGLIETYRQMATNSTPI